MNTCLFAPNLSNEPSLTKAVEAAVSGSFSGLALPLEASGYLGLDAIPSRCGELRDRLTARGLRVVGLVLEGEVTAGDLAERPGEPSLLVRRMTDALDRAAWCGAKAVVVPASWMQPCPSARFEDALSAWLAALQAVRFAAMARAVQVLLETGFPGLCRSITETRRFLDEVNSPFVGAAVTIANPVPDETAVGFIEALTHRVRWIRLVAGSGNRNASAPLIDGPRDSTPLQQLLWRVRFDGVIEWRGGVPPDFAGALGRPITEAGTA